MKLAPYAEACVTPGWHDMTVWFNGYVSEYHWLEVNAAEGWGIRYTSDAFDHDPPKTELVRGAFKLIHGDSYVDES